MHIHHGLIEACFRASHEVRYVAVHLDGDLRLRSRADVQLLGDNESDRYEELIVNPTLLELLTRRGDIDCGGLRHVVVRYGHFDALILPVAGGHVTISLEQGSDLDAAVPRLRAVVDAVARVDAVVCEPLPRATSVTAEALLALSPHIRYVATHVDGVLRTVQRADLSHASSAESDRYEELLVNPTLLALVTRRGDIDCGGAQAVFVRYGHFTQFIVPVPGGHASVAIEPDASASAVAAIVMARLGAGAAHRAGKAAPEADAAH